MAKLFKITLSIAIIFWNSLIYATPKAGAKGFWALVTPTLESKCTSLALPLSSGTGLHRPSAKSFAVDSTTQNEMKVPDLLFPLFAQHSPTDIGKTRLKTMMIDSALSIEEIHLRQQAVKNLVGDDRLLFELQAYFQEFSRLTSEIKLGQFLSGVDEGSKLNGLIEAGGASTGYLGYAMAGFILSHAQSTQDIGYAVIPAFISTMMLFTGSSQLNNLRARHTEIRRLILLAEAISQRLEGSSSELLRSLGQLLGSFQRSRYESPRNRTVRSYLNTVGTGLFGRFLDHSYYSSFSLRFMNRRLSQERQHLLELSTAAAELAALAGIATYSKQPGMIFPTIRSSDSGPFLSIIDGHHPYVLADIKGASVSNTVRLSAAQGEADQLMVITGVNGGGKSTYLRMVGSLVLLGQMGSAIPAAAAEWTPLAVASNMSSSDSLEDSESLFRSQVRRIKEIMRSLKNETSALVVIDEPFKGTSPRQHAALERALIRWILKKGYLGALATHSPDLPAFADGLPGVSNYHFSGTQQRFSILPGPSQEQNARELLSEEEMPDDFIEMYDQELEK